MAETAGGRAAGHPVRRGARARGRVLGGAEHTEAEDAIGLPVGRIVIMPAVQTAAGGLAAAEIARAPRVAQPLLAEARLRAQLRLAPVSGPRSRTNALVRPVSPGRARA
ncbi:hypothetical protein [Dactylosporangium sp. CA-233914]|uniref:hypothetical protein n=1 Tax=Dactylosporangium sp. CA-233914 TaxID=3239934 RepID=UPI003D944630